MKNITSMELASKLDEYLGLARSQPIEIDGARGAALVLLSAREYDRLQGLDDMIWGELAKRADKQEIIRGEDLMRFLEEGINAAA